jgi:hypothetical protein
MSKLFQSRGKKVKKSGSKSKSNVSFKTKLNNVTATWNFRKITKYFVIFGVIIAVITSYFWYTNLYMTPERRFWIAVNNSMATPSVVRTLTQGGSGNQVTQDYRFNFAPQRVVENQVVYTERSALTDTSVTTEGVIYPTVQYLRYTDFTNSRSDNQDTANIDEVLGAWAVQESEDEEQARLNYLSEQVSLVMFGNYEASFRNEVIKEMKNSNVYGENLKDAIANTVEGESVYIYQIQVKLSKYAELLNRAFVRAGYGEFPPLNPDNYAEDSTVNGELIVSKKSNSVVGVNFGGREEVYGNYGVIKDVKRPEASLTIQELQQKVQELLQADF